MLIDVVNTVLINRPVAEVSRYAADPDNAPLWYENIKSVERQTPPPAQLGSRIDFVASFLGRRLAYTYEIVSEGFGVAETTARSSGTRMTRPRFQRRLLRLHGPPSSDCGLRCLRQFAGGP